MFSFWRFTNGRTCDGIEQDACIPEVKMNAQAHSGPGRVNILEHIPEILGGNWCGSHTTDQGMPLHEPQHHISRVDFQLLDKSLRSATLSFLLPSTFSRHHASFQQIADSANSGVDSVLTLFCRGSVKLVARPIQPYRQSRISDRPKLQGVSERPGLWM